MSIVEILELSNLNLKKISVTSFPNTLIQLDLSKNYIKEIPLEMYSKLPNLQKLNLETNQIQTLSSEICKCSSLKYINLNYNQIEHLPDGICLLINLITLSVSNNNLRSIPNQIILLRKSLKYLYLNNNRISYLHIEIGELTNLSHLYIQGNKFLTIPTSIHKLEHLEEFSLEWFTYVSPPFPQCIKLNLIHFPFLLLQKLLRTLYSTGMKECAINTFLSFFSTIKQDPYKFNSEGRCFIHNAAINNDISIVNCYISNGFDLNILDSKGNTALIFALKHNHVEIVKMLLKGNVNLEIGSPIPPLNLAIQMQNVEIIKTMLNKGAHPKRTDQNGNSALHTFMKIDHSPLIQGLEIMEELIKFGADLTQKNKDGENPIHYAVMKNQYRILKFALNLLKRQLKENYNKELLNILNIDCSRTNDTNLIIACKNRHMKIIKMLINHGCSAFKRNINNESPK